MVSFTKLEKPGIDYNIEEDYDGKCRRYIFNQKSQKAVKEIDVELEIHTTCLDDSCWYEYHILEFTRGVDNSWLILSHKKGNRCYEDRGGGSPLLLIMNIYNNPHSWDFCLWV